MPAIDIFISALYTGEPDFAPATLISYDMGISVETPSAATDIFMSMASSYESSSLFLLSAAV